MRPTQRGTGSASQRLGSGSCWAPPAASTAQVASTGSSAADPGNGVVGDSTRAATPMPASPAADRAVVTRTGREASRSACRASSAPAASSKVRAAVEKYAVCGEVAVSHTDQARLAAATTPTTTVSRRRRTAGGSAGPVRLRPATTGTVAATASRTAGQTR